MRNDVNTSSKSAYLSPPPSQCLPTQKDISLRQWILKTRPAFNEKGDNLGYAKLALPIALKLAELLIAGKTPDQGQDTVLPAPPGNALENHEQLNDYFASQSLRNDASPTQTGSDPNAIPLECIQIENVVVEIKQPNDAYLSKTVATSPTRSVIPQPTEDFIAQSIPQPTETSPTQTQLLQGLSQGSSNPRKPESPIVALPGNSIESTNYLRYKFEQGEFYHSANTTTTFPTDYSSVGHNEDDWDYQNVGNLKIATLTKDNFSAVDKSTRSNSSKVGSFRNSGAETKEERLVALGLIFYELFSGTSLLEREELFSQLLTATDIQGINLNSKNEIGFDSEGHKRARSQTVKEGYSRSLPRLNFLGVPRSICDMIGNLFDCYIDREVCNENLREEVHNDSYLSFQDVRFDLKLMINHPDQFLEDVNIGRQYPIFSPCKQLIGRANELSIIEKAYERSMSGDCQGVIIRGQSGSGKSKLAMHISEITSHGTYFVGGKFDQNEHIRPLNVIASAFNDCCDLFLSDCSSEQRKNISEALESAFGNHVMALIELLPSLKEMMPLPVPSQGKEKDVTNYVDSEKRLHYLFCIFIQILSSFVTWPITLFLDDLQWADESTLSLLRSILVDAKGGKYLFFVGCVRTDEKDGNDAVSSWMRSISAFDLSMEKIRLESFTPEIVNQYVSYSLGLFPRLTRPLANTLHQKTNGNPLFLRRLTESLRDEGLIYFSFSTRRWMWDLNKIKSQELADGVVNLLMKKMRELPENLQRTLKVVSCIGVSVDKSLLEILSKDVKFDLGVAMDELVRKGYMHYAVRNSNGYSFVHDKIQQAAYGMIPPSQRPLDHLRYGLAICAFTLESRSGSSPGDDGQDVMFFTAVNQINHGKPSSVRDSSRKAMIAALNLKAGKRSIVLSDFLSAFKFFKHGISFLEHDHWNHKYDLSLELYDAITEAACALGKVTEVERYCEIILSNARCFNDKLNSLYTIVCSLRRAERHNEAKMKGFEVLRQLGEDLPLPLGDNRLNVLIRQIKIVLTKMGDDYILNLGKMTKKKLVITMKLYLELSLVVQFVEPLLMGSVSLRMVQLTLLEGLCPTSPLAFAYFGCFLVANQDPSQGYCLGKLALKLLRKLNATEHTSSVIALVYGLILWMAEPIQSTNVAHMEGHRAGMQSGDMFFSVMNYQQHLISNFVSGQRLAVLRKETKKFIQDSMMRSNKPFIHHAIPLYFQTVALIEGDWDERSVTPSPASLVQINTGNENLPSEESIIAFAAKSKNSDIPYVVYTHQMIRAFLFQRHDMMAEHAEIVYKLNQQPKRGVRILFILGIFYEGLISFVLARRAVGNKWILRAEEALASLKYWSQFSEWNFENKVLLLEAEKMAFKEELQSASSLYDMAIQSSHRHKFIQEEGIACELAALFHLEKMKSFHKSMTLLTRSRNCYQDWGAMALVSRIEHFMEKELDPKTMLSVIRNQQRFST